MEIVEAFIKCEKVTSQRVYEQKSIGKNIPSLSAIKEMLEDVRPLSKRKNDGFRFTDFELLLELESETVRLKLQDDLSITKFRRLIQSPKLPSVDTIMKRINKNWEELTAGIGFGY